ncbi:MAG: chaperonin GroEL [Vicinamibacterales bacterium]
MKRAFISYGRESAERVRTLADDIGELGHECWIDGHLSGGQMWWSEILRRIRECDLFVFAVSPASIESRACRLELEYAQGLRRPILPILVADAGAPELFPLQLGQLQLIDYRISDRAAVMRLARAIGSMPGIVPLPDPLPPEPQIPMSSLGTLRDLIETGSPMTFAEQTSILVRAKQVIQEHGRPDDVRQLLRMFRRRDDLLARVADEVDELLGAVGGAAAASEKPDPKSGPIQRGLDELVKRVRICFGPGHRTVVVPRGAGEPLVTASASAVVDAFVASDPAEAVSAQIASCEASVVNELTGSGAGTTAILTHALYEGALAALAGQPNPTRLVKDLEHAVEQWAAAFKTVSRAGDREAVDAVVRMMLGDGGWGIGQALDKVGLDGTIVIEESRGRSVDIGFVDGTELERGFVSDEFVTDQRSRRAILDDVSILMTDARIADASAIVSLYEQAARAGRSLLVIALDIDPAPLDVLLAEKHRGARLAVVQAPGFGERRKDLLGDLAVLSSGRAILAETGISIGDVRIADLGRARRVIVGAESTVIVGTVGNPQTISDRAQTIRAAVEETDSEYFKERLVERLQRLTGGVSVIRVGGPSPDAREFERASLERVLRAVRYVVYEGVVPGGGIALLRTGLAVSAALADAGSATAAGLVRRACEAPVRQLALNAGDDPDRVVTAIVDDPRPAAGFNALTGAVEDLVAAGVIDSAASQRLALEAAGRAAARLLWSTLTV